MIRIILALILLASQAFAAEVVTTYEKDESLPVLNEELRKKDSDIRSLKGRVETVEAVVTPASATQAQMEAASSVTVYVSPGRAQYHPGIAKAWAMFNGTTVGTNAPTAGYNVTSVTRNGTGDYTVTFTIAMSSANYVVAGTASRAAGSSNFISLNATTPLSTGSFSFLTRNDGGTAQDCEIVTVVTFGDQ